MAQSIDVVSEDPIEPVDRFVTTQRPGPLGHPRGLWVLSGTELWDRISWHGMVSMLVLYMTGELLRPDRVVHVAGWTSYHAMLTRTFGTMSDTAIATQTFSLYFAGITFLPLIGGWLGDRVITRRTGVTIGALTMTLGHFLMAFDATFLAALVALMLGAGLLRGNLSPQIRALYAAGDRRLGEAFQVYNMAVNLGAFIAPLVCSTMAKYYGWHAGFAVAGFGMLIGLVWFLAGSRDLPPQPPRSDPRAHAPMTAADRRNIVALLLIWPFSVAFWSSQAQIWNVYNLWVRDHVDMTVGSFAVPVPWLQSLDGLAPAVFIPLLLFTFRAMARRGVEPDILVKMAWGSLLFATTMLLLAAAPLFSAAGGRAPIWLPIAFHLGSNAGAACFAPYVQSLFAARAPERLRGTMLGVYALSVTAASLISGPMGNWYTSVTPTQFWIASAGFAGIGGALLLLIARPLRRWMGPDSETAPV
ncbi:peptide MFS transporter [Novosphingobium sp.]|uniref:peptide MFS transporter n=1 Tax=Novosphingobium sp. TaxID=1874826 RepID=UPI00333FE5AC